jgi:TRAP-type mannitol/chloroaromatic compound transport system permease small subunit
LTKYALNILAVLLLVLMLAIALQVLCSALAINPLLEFSTSLVLLGNAITLNSLLDFQWHILVIVGLLPAGLVWKEDKHVRVDFIHSTVGPRLKNWVDTLGNLLFALPFFVLILPASLDFFHRAWLSGEGSRNGGLNDLWLIKLIIPLGLALVALAIVRESLELLRRSRTPGDSAT